MPEHQSSEGVPGPPFSPAFFDEAYRGSPGWEIGRAQPDLIAMLEEFPSQGPILDVGCGTGDLSRELARRGHTVLGVDVARAAIERARDQVDGANPSFRVGDALDPASLPEAPFGAVVDSAFTHLFGPAERDRFASSLARALKPGGRYYILGFGIQGDYPSAPKQVTMEELHARFAPGAGWKVLAIRPANFVTSVLPEPVPAVVGCVERSE